MDLVYPVAEIRTTRTLSRAAQNEKTSLKNIKSHLPLSLLNWEQSSMEREKGLSSRDKHQGTDFTTSRPLPLCSRKTQNLATIQSKNRLLQKNLSDVGKTRPLISFSLCLHFRKKILLRKLHQTSHPLFNCPLNLLLLRLSLLFLMTLLRKWDCLKTHLKNRCQS